VGGATGLINDVPISAISSAAVSRIGGRRGWGTSVRTNVSVFILFTDDMKSGFTSTHAGTVGQSEQSIFRDGSKSSNVVRRVMVPSPVQSIATALPGPGSPPRRGYRWEEGTEVIGIGTDFIT
jgi:hypothetical protein